MGIMGTELILTTLYVRLTSIFSQGTAVTLGSYLYLVSCY